MPAKIYRTIRKPHTYLLNTRHGHIRVTRSGAMFMVNIQPREIMNANGEVYEESTREEFDQIWDDSLAMALDIMCGADDNAFRLGNRVEEVVTQARSKIA